MPGAGQGERLGPVDTTPFCAQNSVVATGLGCTRYHIYKEAESRGQKEGKRAAGKTFYKKAEKRLTFYAGGVKYSFPARVGQLS